MICIQNQPRNITPYVDLQKRLLEVNLVYKRRMNNLKKYESSANPKQSYIAREGKFLLTINQLIEPLQSMYFLNLWQHVDLGIQEVYSRDKTISGFHIQLSGLEGNGFMSRVCFNLNDFVHD